MNIKKLSTHINTKIRAIEKEEFLLSAKFKKGDILFDQYKVPMEIDVIKVLDMTRYYLIQYIGYTLTKKLTHRKDKDITYLCENKVCQSIVNGKRTIYYDTIDQIRECRFKAIFNASNDY